jgi:hypothetical protein
MSLREKLDNVTDFDTFLEFVKALIEDWEAEEAEIDRQKKLNIYNPMYTAQEWQNGSIGQYLDAASAWAEAVKDERMPENPTWKTFAWFLYAGKSYE